jgi:hypothetical protein
MVKRFVGKQVALVLLSLVPMSMHEAKAADLVVVGNLLAGVGGSFEVTNATANANILLFATAAGEGLGPCPVALGGTCMDILSPKKLGSAIADANGDVVIVATIPAQAVGAKMFFQVVDTAALTLSGVVSQDVTGPIGSFVVHDGPDLSLNPVVLSCLDTCAQIFGGVVTDYRCSTSDVVVDNSAFVSGWGDATFCTTPVAGDFKLEDPANPGYDCGSAGCSYSAYVLDNCTGDEINYCWGP